MKAYYVLSGEGEQGSWDCVNTDDIFAALAAERCGGDRWARAYGDCYETSTGLAGVDVETGETRSIPLAVILGAPPE